MTYRTDYHFINANNRICNLVVASNCTSLGNYWTRLVAKRKRLIVMISHLNDLSVNELVIITMT